MQVNGKTLARYTGTVHILRPTEGKDKQGNLIMEDLQIKVQQLHTSWDSEAERLLPPPEAPIVGTSFKDNPQGEPKRDEKDPAYRAKLLEWQQCYRAKRIHDATIDDRIVWETEGDPKANPWGYYGAIWAELSESFSSQEIARWDLTIVSIDAVGGADIALAEEALFRAVLRGSEVPGVEELAEGEHAGTEPAVP